MRLRGEKIYCIFFDAYRSPRGVEYVSILTNVIQNGATVLYESRFRGQFQRREGTIQIFCENE